LLPGNGKTGVNTACRYDPDSNPTYQKMAMHYGIGVVPARPYKPRDRAKVESGVLLAVRWIIAAFKIPAVLRSCGTQSGDPRVAHQAAPTPVKRVLTPTPQYGRHAQTGAFRQR
jgi:transposase